LSDITEITYVSQTKKIPSTKNQISNKFQSTKIKIPKNISSAMIPYGIITDKPGLRKIATKLW